MINKNYYEELVDELMIEETGLSTLISEKKITELKESDGKRMAILSMLDPDRGAFGRIHSRFSKAGAHANSHIKEVVKMLREYVKVTPTEKKKFGEVMTPIFLVEEMLDTLPKEVWSDPTLKWLDPANGVGVFPAVIIERLMVGLTPFFPSPKKRYKHILENMIYVCELQAKNMFLHLCAFDPQDKLELNIYHGSFLDEGFDKHMKEVNGVEKFDVIVGNPPYQGSAPGAATSPTIWHKFVLKSLSVLRSAGYLLNIHPPGWRNIEGKFKKTQTTMLNYYIRSIKMFDIKKGLTLFGAATPVDFYLLEKTPIDECHLTAVTFTDGKSLNVSFANLNFIPSRAFEEVLLLIAKDEEDKVEVLHSRSNYGTDKKNVAKTRSDEFKYECVKYLPKSKPNTIDFRFSNTDKNGHFGIPKVMFGTGSNVGRIEIDADGEYGMCEFTAGIVAYDKKEQSAIRQALLSDEFQDIMAACRVNTVEYNRRLLAAFRKDFWKEFV